MTSAEEELALDALRALADWVIPETTWGQFPPPTLLYPQALPPHHPVPLPLPPGARLIGSCVSGAYSQVVVEAVQRPQEIQQFYERALLSGSWSRPECYETPGLAREGVFCAGQRGPSLTVSARSGGGRTDLRLTVDADAESNLCARPPGFHRHAGRHMGRSMPLLGLTPPPGATYEGRGNAPGLGSHVEHATFRCDLKPVELRAYFANLLIEKGWRQGRMGQTGPVVWSSWVCANESEEEVNGFLLAFAQGEERCTVRLERDVSGISRREAERETWEESAKSEARWEAAPEVRAEVRLGAIDDPVAALGELILRVRGWHRRPDEETDPELLLARLPDSLPLELPILPETQVLATLVWPGRWDVYMLGQALPSQIVPAYEEHFPSPVWRSFKAGYGLGGFAASRIQEVDNARFMRDDATPGVSIYSWQHGPKVTRTTVTVASDPNEVWQVPHRVPGSGVPAEQPGLPSLTAPEPSDFQRGGGSGGMRRWESAGWLLSDLGPEAIAEHYGNQMRAAGWEADGHGMDEAVAWSSWSGADELGPFHAILLIMRPPGGEACEVLARAYRPGDDPGGKPAA
jgi:hypothetical protein